MDLIQQLESDVVPRQPLATVTFVKPPCTCSPPAAKTTNTIVPNAAQRAKKVRR
jgi:hypothetical protein